MIYNIILYFGVFIFAITGALKARVYRMDIFGAFVLAFMMAYGGGTIRDLLLNKNVNWLSDYYALLIVFISVVFVYIIKNKIKHFKRLIFITDAIGIGLFTITGINVSLQYDVSYTYSIILGVITATFGGLISDIICNKVPDLLKNNELYATSCIVGGIIYSIMSKWNIFENYSSIICIFIIVSIRILSHKNYLKISKI